MSDVQKKELDITHGPLVSRILLYALPVMLSGVLQLCFNAADLVVVGRFASGDALAAVGATGSLTNLIVNLFMGLGVGVSVNVAHAWGAHNEDAVSRTIHTALLTGFIGGIIVMLIGVLGSPTFLLWMGTPDNVINLSALYMRIYFLGMPANMVYNFGAAALRAVGDTKRPLYFLIVAGVVNVILNLVLVIVFDLSVAGVAIATVISQVVSAVLVLLFLRKQTNCCHLSLRALRIHPDRLMAIIRIGVPSGIQSSLFSISNVLIQSSINSFGSIAMEGNTAAGNLEGFVYIIMNAFYHTSLTFIGQNIGARQYHRLRRITLVCLALVSGIGFVIGVAVYGCGEFLLAIYSSGDSAEMIAYGMERLSVITVTYFLCGMMETFTGVLRGMGKSFLTMVISLVGACGFRIVWIYTVFAANRTLVTLYLSWPASWILTILMQLVALVIVYRRFMRQHANEKPLDLETASV